MSSEGTLSNLPETQPSATDDVRRYYLLVSYNDLRLIEEKLRDGGAQHTDTYRMINEHFQVEHMVRQPSDL
jgi:hypothetical protein